MSTLIAITAMVAAMAVVGYALTKLAEPVSPGKPRNKRKTKEHQHDTQAVGPTLKQSSAKTHLSISALREARR